MHEAYRDDYASLVDGNSKHLIPGPFRRAVSALVFLALVLGMGVWAWRLGTRDAREVPIIRAMEGPARITPDEQGGFEAANTGLELNAVLEGAPAPVPRDTPTAMTQPDVLTGEDAPQAALTLAIPSPEPDGGAVTGDLTGTELEASGEPFPGMEPSDADRSGTVQPGELSALVQSLQTPEPVGEPDGASNATAGPRPLSRPHHLRTSAVKPSTSSAATAPVTPKEVSSVATGSRLVQLGAFDSEEITRKAWAALVGKHGDLLGSKSLYVQRTTSNSRVFYRLRVAGFSDNTQTRDMCEALRARGIDCIPVTLQ